MADVFTREKRSKVMAAIRATNTRPEMIVRSMLHRLGYRFTTNGPWNRSLPGKPDIVLPKYRTVIFVHGCFWHAHENCRYYVISKTRTAWWKRKLEGNRERDERQQLELTEAGWNVVTVWECATKTKKDCEWLIEKLPELIGRQET